MKLRHAVLVTITILAAAAPAVPAAGAAGARATCGVRSDRQLICGNDAPVKLWAGWKGKPSPVGFRDNLLSNPSVFKCWARGTPHAGENDIWYYAQGDTYGKWGWLGANNVHTKDDPPIGMAKCRVDAGGKP
ncbi:hypothetical protein [Nonomuraea zeae]|uniref:Ig-like domain-containing protein n=1 Tax=Nonomuraea zeae TaxID=1642303 RepID=A0A5S4GMI9_9ACTN|nr:hypothetical protein [Nonomuraea zeae]TMR33791.1 hypothetical protein ETD85_18795 [Nonomuraea zeae]